MSVNGLRLCSLDDWCDQLDQNIEIPKIQRGFVWKPDQIAGLWDSLLRGFVNIFVVNINNIRRANTCSY
jgi:uncharacterized protein with ParB-like and HNH nuclease domain